MPSPSAMAERNPGVPVSSIDASTVATPCFSFSAYVILLCQKAFHALKRRSVVQHQDGVEETKIFEKILHIPLQDMKTVYRGTLFLRHSICLGVSAVNVAFGEVAFSSSLSTGAE